MVQEIRGEVQLRWADVDALGHVNNVAYATYFDDAYRRFLQTAPRATWSGDGRPTVRHQEITFLRPLMFGTGSTIETRVWPDATEATPSVLAELFEESPEGRLVYARSTAVLRARSDRGGVEPPPVDPVVVERAHHWRSPVRFADLSPQGQIGDTALFEYLQEARIALMALVPVEPTSTVVAQKNVDFYRPELEQSAEVDVWSWVSHVGNRSMTIESVVAQAATSIARGSSTLVFFDADSQRSMMPSETAKHALRARQL